MKEIDSVEDYRKHFLNFIKDSKKTDKSPLHDTFIQALEIRKFEIELYWKRTTYFWAFIAVSFTGYFALLSSKNIADNKSLTIIIAIIGTLFSLSWYLVNRGSKYWQKNWEVHVSFLENEIFGPLFKTVINPENSKFLNLTSEYPFSVSKINQILSLSILLIWIFILSFSIDFTFQFTFLNEYTDVINGVYLSSVFLFSLYLIHKNSETGISQDIKKEKENYKAEFISLVNTKE